MSTPARLPPATPENVALLRIGGLRIVLPPGDVAGVRAVAEVEPGDAEPFSVGWVSHANQRWPVYCLSPELSLLIVIPAERSACVVLATRSGFLGIMCDESASLALAGPTQRHAGPHAMRLGGSPVLGLVALDGGEVACTSSGEHLADYISRLTGA